MALVAAGRVEVGTSGGQVRIRVSGRANHLISQPLREFAMRMVREGCRDFRVELRDCLTIDSTFAGVLAGLSLKLKELAGSVTLVRVPPRCAELLATLGIDGLFGWGADVPGRESDTSKLATLPSSARSKEAWASTILEAHRLLASADPANAGGYEDVVEVLKADAANRPDRLRN